MVKRKLQTKMDFFYCQMGKEKQKLKENELKVLIYSV